MNISSFITLPPSLLLVKKISCLIHAIAYTNAMYLLDWYAFNISNAFSEQLRGRALLDSKN